MIHLSDVRTVFQGPDGTVLGLDTISLSLKAGDFVSVQGASGSGKSTLLLTCGTMLAPTSGTVTLADTDIYSLSGNQRAQFRAKHIGFLFQQFHLIPYLSVRENICTPQLAGCKHASPDDLLEQFGLHERANHKPSQLSIGERQRVGLARALFGKPKIILADEPTGNLDPENSAIVLDALSTFSEQGGTVLMVTHEEEAAQHAQRQLIMNTGRLNDSCSA